jgi:hypothetical protein
MQGLDASEYDSSESDVQNLPSSSVDITADEDRPPRLPEKQRPDEESEPLKNQKKSRKSKHENQLALLSDHKINPVKKLLKLWDFLHPLT